MTKTKEIQRKAREKGLEFKIYKSPQSLRLCLYQEEKFIYGCKLLTQIEKFLEEYEPPEEKPEKPKGIQLNLFENKANHD